MSESLQIDAAATPMMRQYIEIKNANPDSLLFYRMGDFYELFFHDAEVASRALGITLTRRGKHAGNDIPMCGVPVHAADDYLQKLIALGHRVAVCEQTEDPAEAKKRGSKAVVRRDVVRLVTPGTVTEEAILDPRQNAWLAALARVRNGDAWLYGLARIDISTGSFEVAETDERRLIGDLSAFEPRELIVPDSLFSDPEFAPAREQIEMGRCAITPEPGALFDSTAAPRRLQDHFAVATMDSFGGFSRVELAAASAALGYVLKTQVSARPTLSTPKRLDATGALGLDAATRANLELTRTLSGERKGSLLAAIDRTVTPAGSRLLTEHLAGPLTDVDTINDRLDAVSWCLKNDAARDELRGMLSALPDMVRALSRLALERGGPRDLLALKQACEGALSIASWFAAGSFGDLPAVLDGAARALDGLPADLGETLARTLSDEVPLLARDGGFVRQGCSEELDELRALRDEGRQIIAGMQARYCEQTGVKSLKIRHNNILGYFIEVTSQNADALTGSEEAKSEFIHRQTMANAMRFTTTELSDMESRMANAAGRAIQIELEQFEVMRQAVLDADSQLRAASGAIAALDVAAGHAELALSEGYCRPHVDASMAFEVTAGRHPVVEAALRAQMANPFVPNDCRLGPDENRSANGSIWLLTGPNMGGKSTFLRQNALIAIMAQIGAFVSAGSAHIGVVDRIFSRVGAADDLARGRSTFMVEMVETAAILNQATHRSFVILDEIGRGTATYDGLSIAWATLEHLHEVNACRSLFATHYHELTALASVHDRLANVTMAVREWDGDVVFLHEVQPGAADRSYGIQVARLAGLPASVVSRARDVLDQLESADAKRDGSTLIDDLPLFSAAPVREEPKRPDDSILQKAVSDLNPDEMTPKEALSALYDLKARL
ncbi:MAG: DNA mismatch repair protein MutS [Pseudomonadota bacterium]